MTLSNLLEKWLRELAQYLHGEPAVMGYVLFHKGGKLAMASITIPDTSSSLQASVAFLDEHGHATTADDVPQWTSSDENVAILTPSEDGLSCSFQILGPGVTLIDVTSTNEDGSTAQAQGTITVQPGDAVIGEVSFTEDAEEGGEVVPPPAEGEEPA